MIKKIYAIFILSFLFINVNAQHSISDSMSLFIPGFQYKLQIPYGGIADRFGINHDVGISISYKLKNNWIFGLEGDFLTGYDIKNKDSLLSNLQTSKGYIINSIGYYADIAYYERGFTGFITVGKVFPVSKKNPNSGILFSIGGGFLQYKNFFEILSEEVPQLSDDYLKGYDRMVNGWATKQFLGYIFLSDTRYFNFYAGVELIEAWTTHRRSYNYKLQMQETETYFDMMLGFKVGWVFPIYRKVTQEYYFE